MLRHHSCRPIVGRVEPLALTSSAPLAGASPLGPVRGSARGARQWVVVGAAQAVTAVIVSLGPPRQPTRRRGALLGACIVAQLGSQATALLQLLPVVDLLLPLLLFQLCHFLLLFCGQCVLLLLHPAACPLHRFLSLHKGLGLSWPKVLLGWWW